MNQDYRVLSENLRELNKELEKLPLVSGQKDNIICIMDSDANMEWASDGFVKKYGISPEKFKKIKGENFRNISFNKNIDSILHEIITKRISLTYQSESIDNNGKKISSQTTITPVFDEKGEIIRLMSVDADDTKEVEYKNELGKIVLELKRSVKLLEEKQKEAYLHQKTMKARYVKMKEERDLLMTLINNMPDTIYVKDRKSRFKIGNKMTAKIMGAESPDQLIGKSDFDFYPKDMAEEFFKDEQEHMHAGRSLINKEERGKDEKGNSIIKSVTKIPVKDENGHIIGITGIGRNISKQKENESLLVEQTERLKEINTLLEEKEEEMHLQAEELKSTTEYLQQLNKELEKLSLVASKTDNVIVIMDGDANLEWVNNGFIKKYGMSLEEFKSKRGVNLRSTSYNKNINSILEEIIKKGIPVTYQSEYTHKDGRRAWSQTTISPVTNEAGEIVRLIAIDADITRLIEAEMQIQHQKDEIEKQHDELRKLNATKDKFFNIIAHDLKNPFHSIIGFSDLLIRNFAETPDEKKREFIRLIKDSSTSAYDLLENLLNWSRMQTNKIRFSPSYLNIHEIIDQNIHIISLALENKNINLVTPEVSGEMIVYADSNMVNTIIRNLLSNAVKFSKEGGSITISRKLEDGKIKISIMDTGVGISEEDQSKLFELNEFMTTKGTSGEIGTGLGLIICKEFARKMGGDINVESYPGKGSTFTFTIPITEPKT